MIINASGDQLLRSPRILSYCISHQLTPFSVSNPIKTLVAWLDALTWTQYIAEREPNDAGVSKIAQRAIPLFNGHINRMEQGE